MKSFLRLIVLLLPHFAYPYGTDTTYMVPGEIVMSSGVKKVGYFELYDPNSMLTYNQQLKQEEKSLLITERNISTNVVTLLKFSFWKPMEFNFNHASITYRAGTIPSKANDSYLIFASSFGTENCAMSMPSEKIELKNIRSIKFFGESRFEEMQNEAINLAVIGRLIPNKACDKKLKNLYKPLISEEGNAEDESGDFSHSLYFEPQTDDPTKVLNALHVMELFEIKALSADGLFVNSQSKPSAQMSENQKAYNQVIQQIKTGDRDLWQKLYPARFLDTAQKAKEIIPILIKLTSRTSIHEEGDDFNISVKEDSYLKNSKINAELNAQLALFVEFRKNEIRKHQEHWKVFSDVINNGGSSLYCFPQPLGCISDKSYDFPKQNENFIKVTVDRCSKNKGLIGCTLMK